jgi:hypothetical protein
MSRLRCAVQGRVLTARGLQGLQGLQSLRLGIPPWTRLLETFPPQNDKLFSPQAELLSPGSRAVMMSDLLDSHQCHL